MHGSFSLDLDELALTDIPGCVWQLLNEGVSKAASPLHTLTLATQGVTGPEVRTVVLRDADEQAGAIVFHTDRRSGKLAQLANAAAVSCLFYDRARKLQIRLGGTATVHSDDPLAEDRWQRSRDNSRQCYRHARAPGDILHSDPHLREPPEKIPGSGREHFTAVRIAVEQFDWLYLRAGGHHRARFEKRGPGRWAGIWIAP
jgi:pyridoxamine 5'-phosphate oxidase